MKAVRIIPILLLVAAASAAYVWVRSAPETPSVPESVAIPGGQQAVVPATNQMPAETHEPIQPLEERGDAMLYEIDALRNTPFDEAIVQPFD